MTYEEAKLGMRVIMPLHEELSEFRGKETRQYGVIVEKLRLRKTRAVRIRYTDRRVFWHYRGSALWPLETVKRQKWCYY